MIKYIFSSKKTGKFRKSPLTNKHRVEFPKMVRDVIETSDLILEVLDARFIDKTRNIEMENFIKAQGKKLIYIINKVDLIDLNELKENYDFSELTPYIFFSGKSKVGRAKLRLMIKIEIKKMKISHAKSRVGVIGYPNTGKSTIINILSGKKGTYTSPEAGFTKAKHFIRFNKDIIIIDTPGVFQEKEHPELDIIALKKHAVIGIKIAEKIKEPDMVVAYLMRENPGLFESFYGVDANGDSEVLIEVLGRKRNFLKKGGKVDAVRMAKEILKDWQAEKIKMK
ncbi:MAG: GTPase [archaeon]|nr:GTPase [archaeon]